MKKVINITLRELKSLLEGRTIGLYGLVKKKKGILYLRFEELKE